MNYKIKITHSVGVETEVIELETDDRSLVKEVIDRETGVESPDIKITQVPLEDLIKNSDKIKVDKLLKFGGIEYWRNQPMSGTAGTDKW